MKVKLAWITLAAALSASVVANCFMYHKVRECERTELELRLKATPGSTKEAATNAVAASKAPKAPASTNAVDMAVMGVTYDGERAVTLILSCEPDMDVVRQYITAEPLTKGSLSFRIRDGRWLSVCGDFAHRTNATLRVRRGLPPKGKGKGLEKDFAYSFSRKDLAPSVGFADPGRYLPPCGSRAVRLSSLNVTNVHAEIRRVPSANIVQLLAREESKYRNECGWNNTIAADSQATLDISGAPLVRVIPARNEPNVAEKNELAVVPPDGASSNGVFLVSLRNGDEDVESWAASRRSAYRLVVVTDLGLSVRSAGGKVGVWATSLTTGATVADVGIEVYSSANILVAKGHTDAYGWCECERVADGEPFAVVASKDDGSDMSFLQLENSTQVDESYAGEVPYLREGECDAFAWTDRGIYRHDEKILFHAILRNGEGVAPSPFPLELKLRNPRGIVYSRKAVMPDEYGVVVDETFSVPSEQPSGNWTFVLATPGSKGRVIGGRAVKIEEFAPPQIRVAVEPAAKAPPSEFKFSVSAEHLFGGPAKGLLCEGAVVFEDAEFAPKGWDGWSFGDDDRGIRPNHRRFPGRRLDGKGAAEFPAPLLPDDGRPRAAVKATVQATVFEEGGRPAVVRQTAVLHAYPHYVGTTLPSWLKRPEVGYPKVSVACVAPDGKRLVERRRLEAKVDRVYTYYAYRRRPSGWASWDCERVRSLEVGGIAFETAPDADVELELPITGCGDYVLTVSDPDSGASFSRQFYLSDWGDEAVRAPLSRPTAVAISTDKEFYRVGEEPRLVVKSPFTGAALLSVMRDGVVHRRVLALTNATSEVVLPPCEREWAPGVDVAISVVHGVEAGSGSLAARAHGEASIWVRPAEREIEVGVEAEPLDAGRRLRVGIEAPGAKFAAITVVDEGINLLTAEPVPNPVAWLGRIRSGDHPLYDIYERILPVTGGDAAGAGGVKTGGGAEAELLARVSPVPSRRFKPLSLWRQRVPVSSEGRCEVDFELPEFAGEVRVTAVAYSEGATGSAAVHRKVAPKLVMQPDAPRFAALGDVFEVVMPLANKSGARGDVDYEIAVAGGEGKSGTINLEDGDTTVVRVEAKAPDVPGELEIKYHASGFGETHERSIFLPVRPAVPWRATAGVEALAPGETFDLGTTSPVRRVAWRVAGTPLAELAEALKWLAEYPHGCLEQTSSRIFPLIAADGILSAVCPDVASNRAEFVAAGVSRVSSMIREHDFTMWPDCNYPPWSREVSLYAAHFLVEAKRSGVAVSRFAATKTEAFLKKWAMSTNCAESAYACHTLALAGTPEKDRMLMLYDRRDDLDLLSRARLARAFAAVGDRRRAEALLANARSPETVKEASFLLLALLDLDAGDRRIPGLLRFLVERRDKTRFQWGTTETNAHALLAIGEYYRRHPPVPGDPKVAEAGGKVVNVGKVPAFVAWEGLELPPLDECVEESGQLSISRRFLDAEGKPVDLSNVSCGDLLVAEIAIKSSVARDYADLVVEDLLPGAFEPVRAAIDPAMYPWVPKDGRDWVMRSDERDDRVLVFSKRFHMEKGDEARFHYQVRAVTAGAFALPGVAVEGMYHPDLRARARGGRVVVRRSP